MTKTILRQQSSRQTAEQPPSALEEDVKVDDLVLNPFSKVNQANKQFLEELRPPAKRSFNLAAFVNNSNTLQELLKLGVSLYDIENSNTNAAALLLKLDFEKDCIAYIKFLVDNGVKEKNLGRFITEFPMIFSQHMDDLQTRVNYLESKGFSSVMIAKALNKSAVLLANKTKTLDYKLGELKIEFRLPAAILRTIIVNHPTVISHPNEQYKLINFTLNEEFGFETNEIHKILEKQPTVIDFMRPSLIARLDLIHNTIGLGHKTIAKFPKLITGPILDIEYRFKYLQKLKRDQFNPTKPLYVPPFALYNKSDDFFCTNYAKTSLEDYKLFLKTV